MGDFKVRESVRCPKCQNEIFYYPDELANNIVFCNKCGEKVSIKKKEYVNCVNCGNKLEFDRAEIEEDFIFCQNCGTKNSIAEPNSTVVHQTAEEAVETLEKNNRNSLSPFIEVKENEEIDDETVMEKIRSCSDNWRESIKDSSNSKSVFTDNFAHGMPAWDLLPPDITIRRKPLRRSSERGR